MLAPICLFTYNRLEETIQTVKSLQNNYLAPLSELFVFSDGPRSESAIPKVTEVRNYLSTITGFKSVLILESPVNKGLANSIIEGVSKVIEQYGKIIVLEDDLISSPNFLNFMNHALDFYETDTKIQSINGYSVFLMSAMEEVYFQTRPFPWGWATWSDRWKKDIFDKKKLDLFIKSDNFILKEFKAKCGNDISKMLLNSINNKNDSWYVRWTFDHFRNNNYSIFPTKSYIQNIGHNTNGTHCNGINSYVSTLINIHETDHKLSGLIIPDKKLKKEFLKYFNLSYKLKFRIKLLSTKLGRQRLMEELRYKINLK